MKKCASIKCEKMFYAKRPDQKYCSDICSSRQYWLEVGRFKAKKKPKDPKVCVVCSAVFIPKNPQQKRCKGPQCIQEKVSKKRGRKLGSSKENEWLKSLNGLPPREYLIKKYNLE